MSGCDKFGNNSLIKNPFQIFFRSYDFRMMCDSAMKWIETHPPTWAGHDVRHGLPGLSAVLHSPSHLQTRPRKRNANATTFANYLHRFVWTMDTNVGNGSANPRTEIFASRFINFLYLVRLFIPKNGGFHLIWWPPPSTMSIDSHGKYLITPSNTHSVAGRFLSPLHSTSSRVRSLLWSTVWVSLSQLKMSFAGHFKIYFWG